MEIDKIGIDLGKSVFDLVGLSTAGETGGAEEVFADTAAAFHCKPGVRVIGMEGCGGAHFLGRTSAHKGRSEHRSGAFCLLFTDRRISCHL